MSLADNHAPDMAAAGPKGFGGQAWRPLKSVAAPILIVPGLHGSGPGHWQDHWAKTLPGAEIVGQRDWDRPDLCEWAAALGEAVRRRPGAVLVAHSLGCALTAHLAAMGGADGVAGALLVAPADVEEDTPARDHLCAFAPMPRRALPFPALLVGSRNDPFMTPGRARAFAADWGAAYADAGAVGHINVASGHGPWPEGLTYLDAVLAMTATLAPIA